MAVFHDAATIDQVVLIRASVALKILEVQASFNFTLAAFESEVGKTVSALASLVTNATGVHGFANSLVGKEESTLAGNTIVVVVGLAVLNVAVSVVEVEGLVALLADVVNFVLASKDGVLDTNVVVKTEAFGTVSAGLSFVVREFDTILNGFNARASFQIETYIEKTIPEAQLMQAPMVSFSRQPKMLDSSHLPLMR